MIRWPRPLLPPVVRDMAVLVAAVIVGGIAGALAHRVAVGWTSANTARNIALAMATTMTGSTHAFVVHRQPLRRLVPTAAASVPVVYLAMHIVHTLVAR